MLHTTYGAASSAGVRELNEDAVLALPELFAVADGIGGHAAGEVASAIAVERLHRLSGQSELRVDDVLAAISAANDAMVQAGAEDANRSGMGTTLAGLCLVTVGGSPHWLVFNVGDSRVYRHTSGELQQITVDHSEVEEMVAAGQLTSDEARSYVRRNVVTRSLGTVPAPVVDHWLFPTMPPDRFLVCSDGLTLELADAEILAVMDQGSPPQPTAQRLVELAVRAGGRDNVSVVLVELLPEQLGSVADVTTAPRARSAGSA